MLERAREIRLLSIEPSDRRRRAGVVANVRFDPAVAHAHHPPRPCGDIVFVGDHDDCFAGIVERAEQSHDLVAGVRIEVARRLIGEDDVGIVDQSAAMATRCC